MGADDAGALPSDEPPSSTNEDAFQPGPAVDGPDGGGGSGVVDVEDRAGAGRGVVSYVREKLGSALAHLGARGGVRVAIVDDAAITHEHVRTLGVEGTTDVITFDLADGASEGGAPLDVDLLLCVDEARRRAGERSIPVERELLLYALHGVLHCLGYDDTDDASFARMHAREDEVLRAIGVGATFACGGEVA
ncbi:MAG: rRNA maturation RNase YbeY [Planctomycetota bacterium]